MSPDQEHRLEEIFSATRNLPRLERAAFLERVCAGDAELRRQADSLLAAHEQAGQFLQRTVAVAAPIAPVERASDSIGRYKLLEQIGEGGFGVVWMAEQEQPVRRRVALKIIKLGMDTREVVGRFEAERQALAMMDHPNIASIFDGGATDTGRPFFVLELVKGVPITEYCDANKLGTRERLGLFIQVCQALQHAHQKGVIHRDLKPSNVLVTVKDDRPVPKVIDFGVAKATQARLTEKTLFTRFNQWIGTPAYMSPEQTGVGGLDIDTRSDIYSLGVLLYELLSGATPFDNQRLLASGYDALMRVIREEDPPKPSARLNGLAPEQQKAVATRRGAEPTRLHRLLCGDLDWIVMRALEKDRSRRYETANSLASDLCRHLRDQPVLARPPGVGYLCRKFIRRNRVAVSLVSVVVLVCVFGLCGTLVALQHARREQNRAEAGAAIAAAINSYLQSLVLNGADGGPAPNSAISRQGLDQVAANIDRQFRLQPLSEAAVRFSLGRAYGSVGEFTAAEEQMQRALQIRQKRLGADHPSTLEIMSALAFVRFNEGKTDEAEKAMTKALDMQRRVLGETSALTVQTALMLGTIQSHHGGKDAAERSYEKAMGTLRAQPGGGDRGVLESMLVLGSSLADSGALDEAERLLRDCMERSQRALGASHQITLTATYRLSGVLRDAGAGKLAEAETLGRQVLESREKILGRNHPLTVEALVGLSQTLGRRGRRSECERAALEAYERAGKKEGAGGPNASRAFNCLVDALIENSKWDSAKQLLEEQLHEEKSDLGLTNSQTMGTLRRLAGVSGGMGDWRRAFESCNELIATGESNPDYFRAAAVSALLEGEVTSYRDICSTLLRRFGSLPDPRYADSIAKTCLLATNSVADFQAVVSLADRAVSTKPELPLYPVYRHWFEMAKALAGYRSDRLQGALLHAGLVRQHPDPRAASLSAFICAMAHHRLGQTAQASDELEQGTRKLDQCLLRGELGATVLAWFDTAAAIVIRAEAERTILGQEVSAKFAGGRQARLAKVRVLLRQGESLGNNRQWVQAAQTFASAMSDPMFDWQVLIGEFPMAPMQMAVAFLRAADDETQTKHSRLIIEAFRDSSSVDALERAVKSALLSPRLPADLVAEAGRLAQSADIGNPPGRFPWLKLARGLAEYRSGDYASALVSLRSAAASGDLSLQSPAVAVQAMATKQGGDERQAKELLDRANSLRVPMAATAGWHDLQIFELLREEAERVIFGSPAQPD